MLTFEEAGAVLDEAMEALPEGIFRELNGGVNLQPSARRGEDGAYIMGLYHHDAMGRWIEIFYGSFLALYGDIPAAQFREHLDATLRHELTHHVESLAGDRTLEKWDEEQKALREALAGESWEALDTGSVLFIDEDDCDLAPITALLFAMLANKACPEVRSASAGLKAGDGLTPEAVKAAANIGVDISGHVPQTVTEQFLDCFDAVLCMTLLQADTLALRFPGREEKIMCLGETDIFPPKHKMLWGNTVKRLKREAEALIEELTMED